MIVPEGVQRGFDRPTASAEWRLSTFKGRLGEISGTNAASPLTLAFRLVFEAQQADEPVVWIGGCGSSFFPPDAAAAGIDLSILPVVRVPQMQAAARAADRLMRSGPSAWS